MKLKRRLSGGFGERFQRETRRLPAKSAAFRPQTCAAEDFSAWLSVIAGPQSQALDWTAGLEPAEECHGRVGQVLARAPARD
jgi:hypothetical protein